MFSEREIFLKDRNDVIKMFPEEKDDGVLRSAESRPKRENSGAGIDQLVLTFDGKTYKSGNFLKGGKRVKDRLIYEGGN